jgi:hypothetical protein
MKMKKVFLIVIHFNIILCFLLGILSGKYILDSRGVLLTTKPLKKQSGHLKKTKNITSSEGSFCDDGEKTKEEESELVEEEENVNDEKDISLLSHHSSESEDKEVLYIYLYMY